MEMFSQEAEELLPHIPSCSTMSTTKTARRRKCMRRRRGPCWIPSCKDTTLQSSHMDKLELGKLSPCTITKLWVVRIDVYIMYVLISPRKNFYEMYLCKHVLCIVYTVYVCFRVWMSVCIFWEAVMSLKCMYDIGKASTERVASKRGESSPEPLSKYLATFRSMRVREWDFLCVHRIYRYTTSRSGRVICIYCMCCVGIKITVVQYNRVWICKLRICMV